MSDFKSKLPDLKEVAQITGKLFKDIKNSVGEIISDYKQKHAEAEKKEAAPVKSDTGPKEKKATSKTKSAKETEKDKE